MANMIKFYRGLLENLPATGENGALYITTNEGAIYYGTGDGMKRLGDFIQVDAVANLPVDGANTSALYYCVAENILAKWNGSEWKQVNKQPTADELKTMLGLQGLAYLSEVAESNLNADLATKINNKVDKVEGYSLVSDDEIARLADVDNYDDTALANRVTDLETASATHATKDELNGVDAKFANYVTSESYATDKAATEGALADRYTKAEADGKFALIADAYDDTALAGRVTELETASATHALKTEVEAVDAKFVNYTTTTAQKAIDDAQDAATKKVADDLAAYVESNNAAVALKADKSVVDAMYTNEQIDNAILVETNRAKGVEESLQEQITANANAITTLTDGIDPDKIDGLTDLVNWADEHAPEVASIKEDIEAVDAKADANTSAIEAVDTKVDSLGITKEDNTVNVTSDLAVDGDVFVYTEGDVAEKVYTLDELVPGTVVTRIRSKDAVLPTNNSAQVNHLYLSNGVKFHIPEMSMDITLQDTENDTIIGVMNLYNDMSHLTWSEPFDYVPEKPITITYIEKSDEKCQVTDCMEFICEVASLVKEKLATETYVDEKVGSVDLSAAVNEANTYTDTKVAGLGITKEDNTVNVTSDLTVNGDVLIDGDAYIAKSSSALLTAAQFNVGASVSKLVMTYNDELRWTEGQETVSFSDGSTLSVGMEGIWLKDNSGSIILSDPEEGEPLEYTFPEGTTITAISNKYIRDGNMDSISIYNFFDLYQLANIQDKLATETDIAIYAIDAQAKVDALANGAVAANTAAIATKANADDVYSKSETYTREEVDEAIAATKTDASNTSAVILAEAQKYTDNSIIEALTWGEF